MDPDKLEATNQVLYDLERKLSLALASLLTYTAGSHGLVVMDPAHSGVARQNIRLLVLLYIRDNGTEFDADRVFSDRQQRLTTTFGDAYVPLASGEDGPPPAGEHHDALRDEYTFSGPDSTSKSKLADAQGHYASGDYADYLDDAFSSEDDADTRDSEPIFEDGLEDSDDDDALLPPLPPRLPPRELDPNKLYGLFDFLGPDPLHCTLHRDEPVYLLNDLDNYWWLIKKLSRLERQGLGLEAHDPEDGKIGFVPAECLETYGERLARLNRFKNEELERCLRDTLPPLGAASRVSLDEKSEPKSTSDAHPFSLEELGVLASGSLVRSSSILKKTGAFGHSNKLVTFENLGDLCLDDDDFSDDVMDFSNNYYAMGHDEVSRELSCDQEKHSEVLSDVYPAEAPLQIRKNRATIAETSDLSDLAQPRMLFSGDNTSIGSFSPDTPPAKPDSSSVATTTNDDDGYNLRRSLIIDRLNIVTLGLEVQAANEEHEARFGGSLELRTQIENDSDGSAHNVSTTCKTSRRRNKVDGHRYATNETTGLDDQSSRKSLLVEELSTPLTSVNSDIYVPSSPKPSARGSEKRRKRPVYDMFLPILGQLDELTEKLAELEHSL